ncbi:MAG: preprotein translocase subunit SecY [Armatimonadota bacterium]
MLASLIAAFRAPDLRKRILYVFGMFGVFVIGLHIPVPGVDRAALEKLFAGGGAFGLLDIFSGGALRKYTIFAMGITPYINAQIIMQLLTVAIPQLEQMAKEGESGRKRIAQYSRYLTGVLAFVQAIGMNTVLVRQGILTATPVQFFLIVLTLTAGTSFLMWLGEQITDKGIGNGVSLVIFCSIMARLPYEAVNIARLTLGGATGLFNVFMLVVVWVATVAAVVAITQAQRKVPIQHAKRVVGNKVYGGRSSFLPLRVNSAGVIPIIFAMSLVMIPMTIAGVLPPGTFLHGVFDWLAKLLSPYTPGWRGYAAAAIYGMLIILFTYFYTAVTMNIPEITENLKKWGSFVPGIRPGKPTQEYLDRIMTRITLAGAVFLAAIALMQYYSPGLTGIQAGTFSLYGGTSLLIVVGVALETMQSIEAHLMMRHYEGFIK